MPNPTAPQYLVTADIYTKTFDPGNGLPLVLRTGTYVATQAQMDAIYAAAAAANVTLTASLSAPPGYTTSTSNDAVVTLTTASQTLNAGQRTRVLRNLGNPFAVSKQLARQRADRRALKPLCTDDATITADGTSDTTLTKAYAWPTGPEGGNRWMTQTEFTACPIDIGLDTTRIKHNLYTSSGFAFHSSVPLPSTYTGTQVQIMPRRYKFMTDSAKIQIARFNLLGAQYSGARVVVDGRPYTIKPVAGTAIVDFLHIVFADNVPREIEVFTYALIGTVAWQPTYDVWKPAPSSAPVVYTQTASDGTTVFQDTGGAAAMQEEVWHAEYETFLGIEHHVLDAIAGSGFINRTTGYQSPNNNYADRLPALLAAGAVDILAHPVGPANDISYRMQFGGGASGTPTDAQLIAAMRSIWVPFRAANPDAEIVCGYGLLSPYFQGWVDQYRTLAAAALIACQDIGVVWVDTTGWLTGTGDTGNIKNDGNCDWAIGPDHAHPTAKGARYLRSRWASVLRRVAVSGGALRNTVIS